jgi:hypothetical protein
MKFLVNYPVNIRFFTINWKNYLQFKEGIEERRFELIRKYYFGVILAGYKLPRV